MAPAKANAPPTAHTKRIARGSGTSCATRIGTKKIPLPITFETMMAAASSGPSRRSSDVAGAGGGGAFTRAGPRSGGNQLPRDRVVADRDPLDGAVLGEQARFRVDE